MRQHPRTWSIRWAITVMAAVLCLAGCAPAYSDQTADRLRAQVLAATEASAAGDWAGATATLDQLAADLTAARLEGHIDERRYDYIMTTAALVRTDLEGLIAEQQAAEQAAAEQAAAEQAAREREQQQQRDEDDD